MQIFMVIIIANNIMLLSKNVLPETTVQGSRISVIVCLPLHYSLENHKLVMVAKYNRLNAVRHKT